VYENFFPKEVNERVPHMFNILCLIWAFIWAGGVIFISQYKGKNMFTNPPQEQTSNNQLLVE
jgi:hypothetical protein